MIEIQTFIEHIFCGYTKLKNADSTSTAIPK